MQDQKHLPNLDGLRTLAALSVVLGHCNAINSVPLQPGSPLMGLKHLFFEQAGLGVQFFFVLSGFLITRLVFIEQDESGFNVRLFWLRRILRIWPVYYVVTLIAALAAATGWPAVAMANNNWALILTFLENFDLLHILKAGLPYGMIVSVLWSVSIEEQFYFVYPVLLMLTARRFYLPLFTLVVLAALRFKLIYAGEHEVGFHTFSQCYELGIGCWLAALWPKRPLWSGAIPPWLLTLPYLLSLLQVLQPQYQGFPHVLPWLFGLIILDQAYCPQSWLQTRRFPGLNPLGKITYGIYCYHMIIALSVFHTMRVLHWMPHTLPSFAFYVAAVCALTLLCSQASYRWLEQPCLRLKDRLRPPKSSPPVHISPHPDEQFTNNPG